MPYVLMPHIAQSARLMGHGRKSHLKANRTGYLVASQDLDRPAMHLSIYLITATSRYYRGGRQVTLYRCQLRAGGADALWALLF